YSLTVFKVFFRTMGPPLAMIGFLIAMNLGSNKPAERTVVDCFVLWTVFTLLFNAALVLHARERFREFRRLAAGDAASSWRAFPFLDRAPSLSVPCVPTRP